MIEEIEFKPKCMEPLSRESICLEDFRVYFWIAIDLVTDDRISDRGEMDSDLMGASSEEIYFEECIFFSYHSPIDEFGFCELGIEWIYSCHTLAIMWISPDE
jgi:hypothetical protein